MRFILYILLFLIMTSCNKEQDHAAHDAKMGHDHAAMMEEESLQYVTRAANQIVLGNQKYFVVSQHDTTIASTGFGTIQFDIRRNRKVAARVGGRIEKLYTKYNYQYIRRGEKIMGLYTPELNAYAEEYLHHLRSPGDEALIPLAKEKLLLLGVSERQLENLELTGRVSDTITISSPSEGYVLFISSADENAQGGMNKMSSNDKSESMGMNPSGRTPGSRSFSAGAVNSMLLEGAYVNSDQTLFYINDFKEAWAVLSFDASLAKFLKVNMPVSLTGEVLDKPLEAVINFIEPVFDNQNQKFVQVQVYLKNDEQALKLNALVKAVIKIELENHPVIPSSAVFDMGKRKAVWVKVDDTKNGHVFEVRTVSIGFQGGDVAQVISGLQPGDAIALDVGYLLDSQSLVEMEK